MQKKNRFGLVLRLLAALIAAAGFVLVSVYKGPLAWMNYIGGWETRIIYLVGCGAVVFAAFAVLALQKRSWTEYACMAILLFAGVTMRVYAIDIISPYYGENLAPFIQTLESGLRSVTESGYTPLTTLIFAVIARTGVYPMYCVKLVSIACDLFIALVLTALMEKKTRMAAAGAYLFCPVFFLYGAYAGTMDSAYVLLVLLSALALRRERRTLGWTIFGAAVALDLMSLAALPALLVWKGKRRDRAMLCAVGSCAVLSAPAFALGLPLSSALSAFGGRYPLSMHMRSSSIYNFVAPVLVKDLPEYHLMRYMDGIDGDMMVHEVYTLENMLSMRSCFTIAFLALGIALLVLLYRHRAQLADCRDELVALLPLAVCMFLPGVDAACFILADIGMVIYALRVRGGWRAALLSLGASAVSASAFITDAQIVRLWLCMAAQCVAMVLLVQKIVRTLHASGALSTANAPQRI